MMCTQLFKLIPPDLFISYSLRPGLNESFAHFTHIKKNV